MYLITERHFEGFFSSVGLRLLPVILVQGSPASTAAGGLGDKTTIANTKVLLNPTCLIDH